MATPLVPALKGYQILIRLPFWQAPVANPFCGKACGSLGYIVFEAFNDEHHTQ